jgi:endonuclease/exonuclease/phosphatase family metal-dependent hydrolase
MRIVSYNVHAAVGMDGVRSEQRIAEVLAECEPDVVALQELDCSRKRSDWVDQARCISAWLEMEGHFHPAFEWENEKFGDAILSRWPMQLKRASQLPGEVCRFFGERRGALWVEIQEAGVSWQVFNTHFGISRSERRLQADALAGIGWVGGVDPGAPCVICGDFNSPPGGVVHRALAGHWREVVPRMPGLTFPTRFPIVRLDHFFVHGAVSEARSWVHRSPKAQIASDHFPVVAEVYGNA